MQSEDDIKKIKEFNKKNLTGDIKDFAENMAQYIAPLALVVHNLIEKGRREFAEQIITASLFAMYMAETKTVDEAIHMSRRIQSKIENDFERIDGFLNKG